MLGAQVCQLWCFAPGKKPGDRTFGISYVGDGFIIVIQRLVRAKTQNDARYANSHLAQGRHEDSRTPVFDSAIGSAVTVMSALDVLGQDLVLNNIGLQVAKELATFGYRQPEVGGRSGLQGTPKSLEGKSLGASLLLQVHRPLHVHDHLPRE
jgi:hypothetical protein